MKQPQYSKESLSSLLANDPDVANEAKDFLLSRGHNFADFNATQDKTEAVFDGVAPGAITNEEAIVQLTGRPALLIKNGGWEAPVLPAVAKRLENARAFIEAGIQSVGRVEIGNLQSIPYFGTAWVVDERTLVTNRHVVLHFGWREGTVVRIKTTPLGDLLKPQVDFLEEHDVADSFEVEIEDIIHVEPDGDEFPDLAFLRLAPHDKLPSPIELDDSAPKFKQPVVAIGYPRKDPRNDLFVMEEIFQSVYEVKRLSPGMLTGVEDEMGVRISHDCTTLGGSSGSVILSLESGKALGMHFEGDYKVNNFAVRASVIRERLRTLSRVGSISVSHGAVSGASGGGDESPRPTKEDLEGRRGYDEEFLKRDVPLPVPQESLERYVTNIPDTRDDLLRYTHFSIKMHEVRKLALFTAVNIDGSRLIRYDRGNDQWFDDPRLNRRYQTLDGFYAMSRIRGRRRLHRGHLVRRLDPMWGSTDDEILQAQADTFFFTNCTPQHERFNPRGWLALENYILNAADSDDFRVSVFTGPVLARDDEEFRGFQIPGEFWKVVSTYVRRRRRLSVTGYVLSQARWTDRLEDPYRGYPDQVSLATIESKTELDFGSLKNYDPLGRVESAGSHKIFSEADVVL